ncbi:MAG: N-acetylmuramoyl-L-alanine amidase [Alphaproteobacteria bacterium]
MTRFSRFLGCLLLLGALLSAGIAHAVPEVTGVRVGEQSPGTRVVLDLSEPVSYKLFTLENPHRVVLDLPELAWSAPDPAVGPGVVTRLRHGVFRPGTSRIVFDLGQPARVHGSFMLPPNADHGHRLVVDLEPVGPPAVRRTAMAPSAPVAPAPRRPAKRVVVIDPGHGGVDPGAIGVRGTYEKDITLAAARELRRQLEVTGRYHVVMTRSTDRFLRLRDRVAVARDSKADLFISLHADSHPNPATRGLSVYTLSTTASDKEAAALAQRENRADLIAGVDLSAESREVVDILIDLAQRETMNLSAHYAGLLVGYLREAVTLLPKTHRFAGFAVLKAPDVPSVLVELGYMSNRDEERLLRDPAYRARLMAAVVRATEAYFAHTDSFRRS